MALEVFARVISKKKNDDIYTYVLKFTSKNRQLLKLNMRDGKIEVGDVLIFSVKQNGELNFKCRI